MSAFPSHKFNLIEMSTPFLLTLWGIWIVAFDPMGIAAVYENLNILPQYFWGAMFFLIGAAKGYSILYNKYHIRRRAALGSIFLWAAMATLFAGGNHRSLLVPTCIYFGYQSFLSWHRISPLTSRK